MSTISTHVLDTSRGRPAAGLEVELGRRTASWSWRRIASGTTDGDGRVQDLLPAGEELAAGTYRLRFAVGPYFERREIEGFYPWVDVVFRLGDAGEHYHVPLLLSPFGYSTYRGS